MRRIAGIAVATLQVSMDDSMAPIAALRVEHKSTRRANFFRRRLRASRRLGHVMSTAVHLTYAPAAAASGTLSLNYRYDDNSGTPKLGSVSIAYTAAP
jgi:hypothetical protein